MDPLVKQLIEDKIKWVEECIKNERGSIEYYEDEIKENQGYIDQGKAKIKGYEHELVDLKAALGIKPSAGETVCAAIARGMK